jgi:hypothetical protein
VYKEIRDQMFLGGLEAGMPALYCIGLIRQNHIGAIDESNDVVTEKEGTICVEVDH